MDSSEKADYSNFAALDVRVGEIKSAKDAEGLRNPSYLLKIDFGDEIGEKQSCAQLTENYTKEELAGMKIMAVVNFAARQIGKYLSEVLTLGVPDENGKCVLVTPDKDAPIGAKLY